MNLNLEILDSVDRTQNIYEWICDRAKRAHEILGGIPAAALANEQGIAFIVMEEFLHGPHEPEPGTAPRPDGEQDATPAL